MLCRKRVSSFYNNGPFKCGVNIDDTLENWLFDCLKMLYKKSENVLKIYSIFFQGYFFNSCLRKISRSF